MKRIIKDEDLILYVNDTLSGQTKKEFELQAIQNNESDLLLNCILANYSSQRDYADELLGVDDFLVASNSGRSKVGEFSMPMAADKKNKNDR